MGNITDAAGGAVGLLMDGPEPEWKDEDDKLKISDDEDDGAEVQGAGLLVDESKLNTAASVIDLLMGTEEAAAETAESGVSAEIGMRFQMGSLYYAVQSVAEYVVCIQIEELKSTGFPMEVLLESNQFEHVQVLQEEDYQNALSAYTAPKEAEPPKKEEEVAIDLKEGDRFKMGGVEYAIESMGDVTKCKQCGQNGEFPAVIYLARNQLRFVVKIEADKKAANLNTAKSRIAMFENPQGAEDKKPEKRKPKVNKLKKNALNAKFGGIKINPMALKPGSPGKHRILSKEKDGTLNTSVKVEQATIQRGKRKRKRKKVHVAAVSQAEQEIENLVAPQLFLDKKAAAKERAERERAEKKRFKEVKAAEKKESGKKASSGGGGSAGKTAKSQKAGGGGSGGNYSKAAREEPDPDDDPDDRAPANSGGCCLVM